MQSGIRITWRYGTGSPIGEDRMSSKRIYVMVIAIICVILSQFWASGGQYMTDRGTECHSQEREANSNRVRSWAEMLDAMKQDPQQQEACESVIKLAQEVVKRPIARRVYSYEDVGKYRTWLDGRAKPLEPEIQETFALAMSDFGTSGIIAQEMPILASAYRLTGDQAFKQRLLEQLSEVATWSPLQRPGWTCYHPGHRLPPDGKDGNWLATGQGIRAIADTLDILPTDTVDPELQAQLERLLADEMTSIVDDWHTKRPWFVRSDNPITNQWVLPTEGLVRACLVLGTENHSDAYELGVQNLLKSLSAHGPAGEFEEGFSYATFTVTSMLNAAHAMAVEGDHRALDHPFLQNFPLWIVHHLQPGEMVINCFDAGGAARGGGKGLKSLLSLLAVCTDSPVASWALENLLDGYSNDIAGFAARSLPPAGDEFTPALFASYEHATRVNWRDSWDNDATGVWVRGGHKLDQHDHQDRGHVNLTAKGEPVLIEAGTPSYDNLLMPSHYASGAGHNVLQIGNLHPEAPERPGAFALPQGWQKPRGVAPITVHKLDEYGGDISIDGTSSYDGLQRWRRNVTWTSARLSVTDHVVLGDAKEDIILFRWHLGTSQEVTITDEDGRFQASWGNVTITLEGSELILVSQEKMPDHTLDMREHDHLHTCLVVCSAKKVNVLNLRTQIRIQ